MKSLKKYFTVMLFAMMGFMAYAADTKLDYSALGTEFTPENSVVILYVGFQFSDSSEFYQINPDYPPNHFRWEEKSGCTAPMVPGSCYIKAQADVEKGSWAGSPSIAYSLPIVYLNKEPTEKWVNGIRITVPSKPGLYVSYAQLDMEALKGSIVIGNPTNDTNEWKKSKFACNYIQKYFKNCAKIYEGTPWEPLINEYVKEWTYEK